MMEEAKLLDCPFSITVPLLETNFMATLRELIEQQEKIDDAKEKLTKHSLIVPLCTYPGNYECVKAEIVFKSRLDKEYGWTDDQDREAGVRIQYRSKQIKIPFELLPSIAKLIQELKISPDDAINIKK